MTRVFAIVFCVYVGIASTPATAQSYSAGYTKYQRGDFKAAERALSQALKTETRKDQRAKTLKLLGICQYMRGDKNAAAQSFQEALALNPSLTVSSSEVLDDSVIDFFKQQQTAVQPPPAPAVAEAPNAAADQATADAAAPPPRAKPRADDDQTNVAAKPAKKTGLRVQANVPGATVLLDGIIAGQVGALLQAEPGQVELEVQAPGYTSQKRRLKLARDKETVVTVTLTKPAPGSPQAASSRGGSPKAKPKPKADASDLAAKPRGKARKNRADDDVLGLDAPARGGAAPRGAPVDPTAEFDRDTSLAPSPYGQPYAQPGYAPPGYAQAAPPPPPPPPDDGYAPQYAPRDARDPAEADERPARGSLVVSLLPFGAGQFQKHDYLLGTVFLAGEVGALYYWYSKYSAANDAQTTANQVIAQDGGAPTGDDATYVDALGSYVTKQRQAATQGLIGFGVLWVAGAAESILFDHAHAKAPKRKRYGGFGLRFPDHVDLVASPTALPEPGLSLTWEL